MLGDSSAYEFGHQVQIVGWVNHNALGRGSQFAVMKKVTSELPSLHLLDGILGINVTDSRKGLVSCKGGVFVILISLGLFPVHVSGLQK